MVPCPISWKCFEKYPFHSLFEHLKSIHKNTSNGFAKNVATGFVFCGNFQIESQMFLTNKSLLWSKAFICFWNFIVQIRFCDKNKTALIWVRLMKSKFQAKYINYKIEVPGPQNKVSYEGRVRNIDEKIDDIVESENGLTIPFGYIKKCLQEDRLNFSVEIKNLKSKEYLIFFEAENYVSEEPMNKKVKLENSE